jgi:arylsulfatase A-like enzyme
MIRFPHEITENQKSELLVQNLDIAPTILDITGIPIPTYMQGESLRNIWKSNTSNWRNAIYYHYYEKGFGATPHYGIRTTRYKLIHFYDVVDSWELYDLKTDPAEMKNIYHNGIYEKTIDQLKKDLFELEQKYEITHR